MLLSILDSMSPTAPLMHWLLSQGQTLLAPQVQAFLQDPTGSFSRLGDLIVWNGETGRQVIAGLDGLGDQVERIHSAVAGIESTQLALQGTLGMVQSVSLATVGLSSLTAGCMLWRFAALEKRLQSLGSRIDDIEGQLDAGHKAHLKSSLDFLSDYESREKPASLDRALDEALHAGNIYGQLAEDEARGQRRLPVLNYRSRCYLLALLTEIECRVLQEQDQRALVRMHGEKTRLEQIAMTMFAETVSRAPEVYLDPRLRPEGVTLELLTEVYRQGAQAGAIGSPQIQDAAALFEHLRESLHRRTTGHWWVWRPTGKIRSRLLQQLRYLMACLEDTNRIEALQLLMTEAKQRSTSLLSLKTELKHWRDKRRQEQGGADGIMAYTFA